MKDKASTVLNDSELRFSGEQGFFDKSPTVRLLIWTVFTLSVLIFLHFKEVQVAVLELNTPAPHYVVAQVDFEFVDRDKTLLARQEAAREISPIYKFSDNEIYQRRSEFENGMLKDEASRQRLAEVRLDEVYDVIDAIQKVFSQARFTEPRTYGLARNLGMPVDKLLHHSLIDRNAPNRMNPAIWLRLKRELMRSGEFNPDTVNYVYEFFQDKPWKLEEDIPYEQSLRGKIQALVPDSITKISSGTRIIDQGDMVTTRQIAMMQAMKKALKERRELWHPLTIIGSVLMTVIITLITAVFIRVNYPILIVSNRKLCLLVTIIVLNLGLAKAVELFLFSSTANWIEWMRYPLIVPFAALLTCNLMTASIATFVTGLLTVLFTTTLAFEYIGFMVLNIVASLIVIVSTRRLKRRKEIFAVVGKAWVGTVVVIFALHLYAGNIFEWSIFSDVVSAAIFLMLTAVLSLGLLPLLESAFHIISDVTLMEYMDPNHELLKRLSFEVPGTYQHTLMVCNLSEAAALAIGANGLFCRVASLYHDIGKMITPHFFTENQQGEMNVHQLLTPLESAQTIMAHVSEGVAMARKAGLPEQFIDIIKEHHGTSLVYFFYRKQLDQVGGDETLVDEALFRYGGPKPRTKESAIIMIADIFEAASRSLDKIDQKILSDLINRLVRDKMDDGQFDECLLTFEELSIIKKTMVQTLLAGLHRRVKYPKPFNKQSGAAIYA